MMTMGMAWVRAFVLIRRVASQPSMIGMERSIRMTSGRRASAMSTAPRPSPVVTTRKPRNSRYSAHSARPCTTSSTTRTRGRSKGGTAVTGEPCMVSIMPLRSMQTRFPIWPLKTRFSDQLAQRTQIQVQVRRFEVELFGKAVDGLFKAHQGEADGFDLVRGQGLRLHAADGLLLHHLAEELDEGEDEAEDGALDVLGVGVPARRLVGRALLDLGAQGLQLFDLQADGVAVAGHLVVRIIARVRERRRRAARGRSRRRAGRHRDVSRRRSGCIRRSSRGR